MLVLTNKAVQPPYSPELVTTHPWMPNTEGKIICIVWKAGSLIHVLSRPMCCSWSTILFHCCFLNAADPPSSLYLQCCLKHIVTNFLYTYISMCYTGCAISCVKLQMNHTNNQGAVWHNKVIREIHNTLNEISWISRGK